MGKHQLFREVPPMSLILKILRGFGYKTINDKVCVCKKYFVKMNIVEHVNSFVTDLRKYYLPCKAKTYLTFINNNSVMTILRQILRPHNYIIVSREKYINREKLINYYIVNKNIINFDTPQNVNDTNENNTNENNTNENPNTKNESINNENIITTNIIEK